MLVTIIRHTAVDVPPHMCYGQRDVPLRDTFEQEAEVVRQNLAGRQFEEVFTSPLSRCTRLAEYCGYPDAEHDPRLLELNFGDWEWVYLYELDDPYVRHWFSHQLETPCPGGESIIQMRNRFIHFIEEKKGLGLERIAVFAHGGILLCAELCQGIMYQDDIFAHLRPYGSVSEFRF